MAPLELMSKTPQNGTPSHRTTQTERRGTRRCKITQLMRIRPSDPEKEHFEDLRGTMSVSRTGVYFVTMPYTQGAASMSREYLAEVVRVEPMANGMTGIGFKILMEMGMQANHSYGLSTSSK